jgi:para-aminobenzoate synthetase component 1
LVVGSGELEIRAILNSLGKTMNQVSEDNASPVAAARAIREDFGMVFLDSGMDSKGTSLLGTQPDFVLAGNDWERLDRELSQRRREGSGYPDGAAVGYVAFDGTFHFGFYDRLHLFSHESRRWTNRPHRFAECPLRGKEPAIRFTPNISKRQFLEMVERAREYIAAGDIYQVCLSHPFVASAENASAWEYFEKLRVLSPAPHSAFLNFGGVQIASSSPECFLRLGGRHISTRPIKGTRPRKPDLQSDRLSACDLITSSKEIAELVMITDLERNDLGRVCEYGSVHVADLLRLETFEQVFHLVSTVEGELREGVSHVQALRECFPGGSISGAPKKRALEIIQELEPHPRGIYTGAIGYFGYNGESQFSIAIRTAVFEEGRASFHVGAGIVADSIPEKEWQETHDKAAGMLLAAGGS